MAYHSTPFDISASGDIVASPGAERRIIVVGFGLAVAETVTVQFVSNGSPDTDLTGDMSFSAGMSSPSPAEEGSYLFRTEPGEPLALTLGDAIQVGGWINWVDG